MNPHGWIIIGAACFTALVWAVGIMICEVQSASTEKRRKQAEEFKRICGRIS